MRGAVLVHVDGHHDCEPAVPSGLVAIGNYVRAAFDEGIVSHVHWVVPPQIWHDDRRRAQMYLVLAQAAPVPITAGPIAQLPRFTSAVLLDVDVDYFFTVGYGRDPVALRLADPASDPAELAATLNVCCPERLVTTIATSITGCFTPFEWKHLGARLAAALDGRDPDPGVAEVAAAYRAALTLQSTGAIEPARAAFARAVTLDPEYRHPFRTPGHVYRDLGRREEAQRCFAAALQLDPADAWATLGLAMLDVDAGRAADALARLPQSPPDPGALDWWRTRGRALAGVGDTRRAVDCYLRALSLAAGGAVPLDMRTTNRDRRLVDPRHWHDHAALARLYARLGEARPAGVHAAMAGAALGDRQSGVVGS